ncbi:PDZ domain-containing protein [Nannocystis pusilla]|uniref:PDZ domain-containing protein n=1 Tax=Nannocystis pusilla TaxID=889268 RepID=A0ABS7U5S0_9BACT|nr:PDZ domain-containing protein [Nannocystis pusilla]MBZ5715904.1 PDZ domain-containing protein [Nannocystis pusilla]
MTLTGKRTDPQNEQEEFVIAKGADCFDVEDDELLDEADDNDPEYQTLRNALLVKAQEDCVEKSAGFNNVKCDPFDQEFDLEWILQATPNVACNLPNTYQSSCPSPGTATEGETSTTTESTPTTTESTPTTTGSTPTTTTGADPCAALELSAWISCSGTTCQVSQDLIDTLGAEPTLLFCDHARLYPKVVSSVVVGMYLDEVRPGGLAGMLGFQEDDVIIAVEGLPFTSEADFAAIALEISDADEVTVTVERGMSTIDLDFERI